MLNAIKAWRDKRRRDKALLDGAEAFVEQFLFTGKEGLADGECDYAIGMMIKAMYPPKPMDESALRQHIIKI